MLLQVRSGKAATHLGYLPQLALNDSRHRPAVVFAGADKCLSEELAFSRVNHSVRREDLRECAWPPSRAKQDSTTCHRTIPLVESAKYTAQAVACFGRCVGRAAFYECVGICQAQLRGRVIRLGRTRVGRIGQLNAGPAGKRPVQY
jgi:hypothetical protein